MNESAGGVFLAKVVSSTLDEQGRIGIEVPSMGCSYQALFASALAGQGRGVVFLPDKGDQVVVAFVNGLGSTPVVLGNLWSAIAKPPIDNADDNNHVKLIQTRSGHLIRLSDEPGKETVEIVDKTGKIKLVFDSNAKTAELSSTDGDITVRGNSITLDGDVNVSGVLVVGSTSTTTIDGNSITGA